MPQNVQFLNDFLLVQDYKKNVYNHQNLTGKIARIERTVFISLWGLKSGFLKSLKGFNSLKTGKARPVTMVPSCILSA